MLKSHLKTIDSPEKSGHIHLTGSFISSFVNKLTISPLELMTK